LSSILSGLAKIGTAGIGVYSTVKGIDYQTQAAQARATQALTYAQEVAQAQQQSAAIAAQPSSQIGGWLLLAAIGFLIFAEK